MGATRERGRHSQCRSQRRDMPRSSCFLRAAHSQTPRAPRFLACQSCASWTSAATPEARRSGSAATPNVTTGIVSCSFRVVARPRGLACSQSAASQDSWSSFLQMNQDLLFPRSFMSGVVCSTLSSSIEAVDRRSVGGKGPSADRHPEESALGLQRSRASGHEGWCRESAGPLDVSRQEPTSRLT